MPQYESVCECMCVRVWTISIVVEPVRITFQSAMWSGICRALSSIFSRGSQHLVTYGVQRSSATKLKARLGGSCVPAYMQCLAMFEYIELLHKLFCFGGFLHVKHLQAICFFVAFLCMFQFAYLLLCYVKPPGDPLKRFFWSSWRASCFDSWKKHVHANLDTWKCSQWVCVHARVRVCRCMWCSPWRRLQCWPWQKSVDSPRSQEKHFRSLHMCK